MNLKRKRCAIYVTASLLLVSMALSACKGQTPDGMEETPNPAISDAPNIPVETDAPQSALNVIQPETVPLPSFSVISDMTEQEAMAMAHDVAAAAQLYYDKYNEQVEMISQNAFLFEYPSATYVSTRMLMEGGDLDAKYETYTPMILYVSPVDLKGLPGITLSREYGEELILLAACNFGDFALSMANGDGGVVPKDAMMALLEKYTSNHGDIVRYGADSDVYRALAGEVASLLDDGVTADQLDMRFLAADEKYAYVVCSTTKQPSNIKTFLFQNEGGHWAVKMSGFERTYQSRKLITSQLPDINMAMLPSFDLYYLLKYMQSNFDSMIEAMTASGLVDASDGAPSFISGTDDFIYLTYATGARFIAEPDEDGIWVAHPVDNYMVAEAFMKEKDHSAPLFIVKQE